MPSAPGSLPGYVERDGDWVWRPPGRLTRVTMHLFVLSAATQALEALCEEVVARPTGGTFRAEPVPPGLVLLTCADIGRGWSEDPDDRRRGWMTERDVGFLVPVLLGGPDGGGVVNLLPYLYVDNFAAVLIGREIFGFPKVLGAMAFAERPLRFSVRGQAVARFDPNARVDESALLVEVREKAPSAFDELLDALRGTLGRAPTIEELTGEACRLVAAALPGGLVPTGWVRIPMAFLKQFRDAEHRGRACHASLVRADAGIDELRSLRILRGAFEVELPRYDSLRIAERLGLGSGPIVEPVVALRAELDFTLPHGRTLWP
jgi:hypothetical protein